MERRHAALEEEAGRGEGERGGECGALQPHRRDEPYVERAGRAVDRGDGHQVEQAAAEADEKVAKRRPRGGRAGADGGERRGGKAHDLQPDIEVEEVRAEEDRVHAGDQRGPERGGAVLGERRAPGGGGEREDRRGKGEEHPGEAVEPQADPERRGPSGEPGLPPDRPEGEGDEREIGPRRGRRHGRGEARQDERSERRGERQDDERRQHGVGRGGARHAQSFDAERVRLMRARPRPVAATVTTIPVMTRAWGTGSVAPSGPRAVTIRREKTPVPMTFAPRSFFSGRALSAKAPRPRPNSATATAV